MRWTFCAVAGFAAALALPSVAVADGIDDFTLVGGGYTITFSEPATGVTQDHPHGVFLTEAVAATVNGVPGSIGDIQILANPLFNLPSVVLSLSALPPVLGSPLFLSLYGPAVDTYVVVPISNPTPNNPDDLQLTLVPATYGFSGEFTNPTSFADFSLSITPEATSPVGATPEPGTLALLSTGLAGGWGVLRRRSLGKRGARTKVKFFSRV